ncbi:MULTISPECIES: hypothetical protein [unclassified Streptomyces]|uniref:hypothetical protein n=1 Tax=unclassified Streptomyces TaxID=2593676 RepID=UPI002DDBD6B6|nr:MULTISPECIES: hypothetical protein [unclassified Streptomyces]WSF81758.1 hypothetical protein OIE70_00180 [Streptomyces sp. NBC_01744]WSC34125.1 hypothetical protein OHA08_00170 [Streptomyces sp. NBC_01763]WSC41933.1 hypothetical protein OHA08_44810 [Streptomyces sp. NBC_01763]WSC50923.1 hypothetical protein OG808_00170 [Streptomyces sp. NBC_01761]WSC58598.1 hypothetical protein OG808_44145 [Streptomyces sp. NBC_01761]
MIDGYVPVLGWALTHGAWIAGTVSFAVIPGGFFVLARLLERRWLTPRGEFAAIAYGDPLLVVANGLGVWLLDGATPRSAAAAPFGIASLAGWLLFGLWQWRSELRADFYTRDQAFAPTKIYHQLVVYPLLGYWSWTAVVGGILTHRAGGTAVAAKVAVLCCVLVWVVTNVYDRQHPRLGHPPYDWRRLRPQPLPWAQESVTLRALSLRQTTAREP